MGPCFTLHRPGQPSKVPVEFGRVSRLLWYGGVIAIGHAMGCTSAALVSVLLDALERRDQRYGCISICGAAGVAIAMVIERA